MRICCIADTQLDQKNTEKYLNRFKKYIENSDCIIHLGDGIENAMKFLSRYENVIYIKGNHDNKDSKYKNHLNLTIHDLHVLFLHGNRTNKITEQLDIWKNKLRFKIGKQVDMSSYYQWLTSRYNVPGIVVYGHIHIPRIEVTNGTCYFCPGGITEKRLLFGENISIGNILVNFEEKVAKIKVISYSNITKKVSITAQKEFLWDKKPKQLI